MLNKFITMYGRKVIFVDAQHDNCIIFKFGTVNNNKALKWYLLYDIKNQDVYELYCAEKYKEEHIYWYLDDTNKDYVSVRVNGADKHWDILKNYIKNNV